MAKKDKTLTADGVIVGTRIFDSPRQIVFDAWADSQQISNWWGPRGFTTTTHHMDVRPGGEWRFVMHGPDGRDYQNRIIYEQVARPERLVYRQVGEAGTEPVQFQVTVVFDDLGDKTKLTVRMIFETSAERDRVAREYGAVEGLYQTLDRLREQLATSSTP